MRYSGGFRCFLLHQENLNDLSAGQLPEFLDVQFVAESLVHSKVRPNLSRLAHNAALSKRSINHSGRTSQVARPLESQPGADETGT
jgi:hypothetical protein